MGWIIGVFFVIIAIVVLGTLVSSLVPYIMYIIRFILMLPVLPFIYAFKRRKEYPFQCFLIALIWTLFWLLIIFGNYIASNIEIVTS